MKLLLILGCQRSGTTLLASMIGGHPEINMLTESVTDDVFKLIGKEYSANKLLADREIRMTQRSSRYGHLVNRIANMDFGSTHHKFRPYPTSKMSIQDYIDKGAKIITISRNRSETLRSMIERSGMTLKEAEREYKRATELVYSIEAHRVFFSDLIHDTENTLRSVCDYLELEFSDRMMDGAKYNFIYPNRGIDKSKSEMNNQANHDQILNISL